MKNRDDIEPTQTGIEFHPLTLSEDAEYQISVISV
jgi:hypothetical protein